MSTRISATRRLRFALRRFRLALVGRGPRIRPEVLQGEDPQLYADRCLPGGMYYDFPGRGVEDPPDRLDCCLCTEAQLTSPAFRYWIDRIGERFRLHRKFWEHAYVIQALYERGMLTEGKRGLGFAVGQEPLPSLFASLGCQITATDLHAEDERSRPWAETGQHASGLQGLNARGLCPPEQFDRLVSYRSVDMNAIPDDLTGYDFTWSSCSFEHCGSIELGRRFMRRQLDCLKPGGVAVHTTEFNLSSNDGTIREGSTVIFRRRDIEAIVRDLKEDGHQVEPLRLDVGRRELDRHVDRPPYSEDRHLRLELMPYAATSIGMIVVKSTAEATGGVRAA